MDILLAYLIELGTKCSDFDLIKETVAVLGYFNLSVNLRKAIKLLFFHDVIFKSSFQRSYRPLLKLIIAIENGAHNKIYVALCSGETRDLSQGGQAWLRAH